MFVVIIIIWVIFVGLGLLLTSTSSKDKKKRKREREFERNIIQNAQLFVDNRVEKNRINADVLCFFLSNEAIGNEIQSWRMDEEVVFSFLLAFISDSDKQQCNTVSDISKLVMVGRKNKALSSKKKAQLEEESEYLFKMLRGLYKI